MKTFFHSGTILNPEQLDARLDQVIADWKDAPGALLPVLQEAQRIYGYLDPAVLQRVADGLGLSAADVASTASFYSFFNREQYGRHIIRLCTSAPCHVNAAGATRAALEEELGIRMGQTTPDGLFSLLDCECLGVCDRAPAVLIDETIYGPVRPQDVKTLLAPYREEKEADHAGD